MQAQRQPPAVKGTILVVRILVMTGLLGIYSVALYAVLHPRVSTAYRQHYIDRISGDWNPTRYHLPPDQIVSLSVSGLPDFVDYDYGFSYPENWGRWTDATYGNKSGFVFNQTFSGPKCFEVKLAPADSLVGKPIILSFGKDSKEISFTHRDVSDYFFDFSEPDPAKKIEFRFTTPVPSATPDPRRLGLSILSFRVFTSTCRLATEQIQKEAETNKPITPVNPSSTTLRRRKD